MVLKGARLSPPDNEPGYGAPYAWWQGVPRKENRMAVITEARLHYNDDNDRFGAKVDGEWEIEGLHCGQTLG